MEKNLPTLIHQCDLLLEERQYSLPYRGNIHLVWDRLQDWMTRHSIQEFSEDVGNSYCDEVIGSHLGNVPGWGEKERLQLRAVRMLITCQENGTLEFRTPRKEYQFDGKWGLWALEYLGFLEANKKLSPKTMESKRLYMEKFCLYMNTQDLDVKDIKSQTISELFDQQGYSLASRKNASVCYKGFLSYIYETGKVDVDASVFILKINYTKNKEIPTTYTEEEIARVISVVNRASKIGRRDYLILLLAAQYGWRAGDICAFKFRDIDWDRNIIRFDQKKTNYPIEFPLLETVGNAIIEYLKYGRPQSDRQEIILSNHKANLGEPIKPPTIHSIVSRYMKTAKIENWQKKKHGPHSFRHSLATNMLKKNETLPLISTVLGHQTTETTKIYLKVDVDKLQNCCLTPPIITSPHYMEGMYE